MLWYVHFVAGGRWYLALGTDQGRLPVYARLHPRQWVRLHSQWWPLTTRALGQVRVIAEGALYNMKEAHARFGQIWKGADMHGSIRRIDGVLRSMEGVDSLRRLDVIIKQAQVVGGDVIPIEQLKGDIARAGHPVKQAIGLDADRRRFFFTDVKGEHLYADFDTADQGYRVKHIGAQATMTKGYDVVDLEAEPRDSVDTTHEEWDAVEEPGMYPSGTPGMKPEEDDRGFSKHMATRVALMQELCA